MNITFFVSLLLGVAALIFLILSAWYGLQAHELKNSWHMMSRGFLIRNAITTMFIAVVLLAVMLILLFA